MKTGFKVILMGFCASLLLAPFAFADDCPMGRGKMSMQGMMSPKMDMEDMFFHKVYFILMNKNAIGLNDTQVEKILDIKYNTKKNLIQKEAEIDLLALNIMQEFRKDDINMGAVSSLLDKKYELKKQKAKDLVNSCIAIKGVLTKEQHKKMKDMWLDAMGKGMCKQCPMMAGQQKSMMPKMEEE